MRRAQTAIRRFDSLRIVGPGWSGNSRQGFQFNPASGLAGAAGGSVPPPIATGACCPESGSCFISTQSVCVDGGGTYQGDNTTCDPDPCPPKGACCVGLGCTIETEDDCTGMGGTYQGDSTDCDPNPCGTTCGGCFYPGFQGIHNYKFQTINVEETVDCVGRSGSNLFFRTTFQDPDIGCFPETCIDAGGTSSCAGGSCEGGMGCSKGYSCSGFSGSGNTCFGLFDFEGLGWCTCNDVIVETIISDTEKTLTCSACVGCAGSSSYTITITLTGICTD